MRNPKPVKLLRKIGMSVVIFDELHGHVGGHSRADPFSGVDSTVEPHRRLVATSCGISAHLQHSHVCALVRLSDRLRWDPVVGGLEVVPVAVHVLKRVVVGPVHWVTRTRRSFNHLDLVQQLLDIVVQNVNFKAWMVEEPVQVISLGRRSAKNLFDGSVPPARERPWYPHSFLGRARARSRLQPHVGASAMPPSALQSLAWKASSWGNRDLETYVEPCADQLVTGVVHMGKGWSHKTRCEQRLQRKFDILRLFDLLTFMTSWWPLVAKRASAGDSDSAFVILELSDVFWHQYHSRLQHITYISLNIQGIFSS